MNFRVAALVLLVLVTSGRLVATDVETWDGVQVAVPLTARLLWLPSAQIRTRDGAHEIFHARHLSQLQLAVSKRVTLLGLYYFIRQKSGPPEWAGTHRAYGGAQLCLHPGKYMVDSRSLVERRSGSSDPWRLRDASG